jgi:hypothetical protein
MQPPADAPAGCGECAATVTASHTSHCEAHLASYRAQARTIRDKLVSRCGSPVGAAGVHGGGRRACFSSKAAGAAGGAGGVPGGLAGGGPHRAVHVGEGRACCCCLGWLGASDTSTWSITLLRCIQLLHSLGLEWHPAPRVQTWCGLQAPFEPYALQKPVLYYVLAAEEQRRAAGAMESRLQLPGLCAVPSSSPPSHPQPPSCGRLSWHCLPPITPVCCRGSAEGGVRRVCGVPPGLTRAGAWCCADLLAR